MLVPLNITGGSYQSRSRPLSAQVTRNFYPELQDELAAYDQYVLQPWPGLKLFGPLFGPSAGPDRGMLEHKGVLHKISGIKFYTVASTGDHTYIGDVVGSGQCILTGFGDNVEIATAEGVVYEFDGSTITETTDVDLETPVSVWHLNNQALYDGDGGRFVSSSVGDATVINSLDYATAESNADDIVRGYAFKQKSWLFGEKTIEPWFNSGVGRPPFDPVTGGIITIGLAARASVSNNDNFMYFLGDDRRVYRIAEAAQFAPVSNIALSTAFASYATVSDAIGFCFTMQGQNFYHLAFPTEDKTWVYSEPVGQWFELSRSGSTGRGLPNSYAFAYGKHLVGDYQNSNIYELDVDTYTENSLPMTRTRDTGPLHAGLVKAPGREIELNRFELILERGVGTLSGEGLDPDIMLSLSIDGGKTFGTEYWTKIGKSADFLQKVEWQGLGRFAEGIIRIHTSDPVPYTIIGANADIEIAI